MTTALIFGVAISVVTLLGLFSTRRADDQLTLLALVAGALNLEFVPRLRRVRGRVRTSPESAGIQVRVSAIGPSDNDRYLIECSFAPPLRMGLELAPLKRPWSSWHWDPTFRDPDLRQAFSAQALHDDQVELLLSGWIRRELMRVRSSGYAPRLDDYSLRLSVHGNYDPQHLKHAIERAARLAEGIVLQRAKLPPSALEREVERAFAPAAGRLGGRFDRSNLALHVSDETGTLEVWVEHVRGSRWRTRFELALERRLAPRLRLADTRHAPLWARWREPEIGLGDPVFDAAFAVRGERKDAAHAALRAEVRSALLELRDRLEQVKLEDGVVSGRLEFVVTSASELERAASAILAVGDAFATTRRTRSAYR